MDRMRCEEVLDRLPERMAGGLAPEKRRAMDAHLSGCEECGATYRFLAEAMETRPDPPAGSLNQVLEAVAREMDREFPGTAHPEAQVVVLPRTRRAFWRNWSLPLPAAAVLVLALGTASLWFGRSGNGAGGLTETGEPLEVAQGDGYSFFAGDDPLVAGAVVLEELSDEELRAILEDWES